MVEHIFTDSREQFYTHSMFVAIKGVRFNGHNFIQPLIKQGCSIVLVDYSFHHFEAGVHYIQVEDTLVALQQLATQHRQQFNYPVIGITGSNGKTIVKEWLYQLFMQDFSIVKSPKSYNSQIGVPLSVLNMKPYHTLGIFEAGISTTNEMEQLSSIIQPTIGIFTNLGSAHNEGFSTSTEKLNEKLQLFQHCSTIILEQGTDAHKQCLQLYPNKTLVTWAIHNETVNCNGTTISLPKQLQPFQQENLAHCIAALVHFNYSEEEIIQKIQTVETIENRLQVSLAKQNVTIVNDSYNNDFAGLEVALKYAHQQANGQPFSAIISFIEQSGLSNANTQQKIIDILAPYPIHQLILLGKEFTVQPKNNHIHVCATKSELMNCYQSLHIANEVLLVKASRKYQLETFVNSIHKKLHDTVWEINLSALIHNINVFKELLAPNVKMMVMVKAFAYGTSPKQLAQLLQHQHIDYLGVAYPNEGKELRDYGIQTPIMVMNTSELTFQTAVDAQLEVETYSIEHLQLFIQYLKRHHKKGYPIHLKIDTGMHRLGFEEDDIPTLIQLIQQPEVEVKGLFSHLATSDDSSQEEFSNQQNQQFKTITEQILPHCTNKPLLHLLNSNGLANTTLPQYNMVRLGIGAYGISANATIQQKLIQIGTLKASISQIKTIQVGETVGYSRKFVAKRPTKVGTITIGYADGFDRRLSNGKGKVLIHNKFAPVIGNVCMDMTMIDLTDIPNVAVGDEVIITSPQLPIQDIANSIGTISYELLTKISPRIPRIFVTE